MTSFENFLSHCPSQSTLLHVYHTNKARPSVSRSASVIMAPHSGQHCSSLGGATLLCVVCPPKVSIYRSLCRNGSLPVIQCVTQMPRPVTRSACRSYLLRYAGERNRKIGRMLNPMTGKIANSLLAAWSLVPGVACSRPCRLSRMTRRMLSRLYGRPEEPEVQTLPRVCPLALFSPFPTRLIVLGSYSQVRTRKKQIG